MTSADDELTERQWREQRAVDRSLARRARATRREYEKAVTRLWIGNAGGAVVTISYVGAAGATRHLAPTPLYFFLFGLVILGLATLHDLALAWKMIRANQYATRPLGLKIGYAQSPLRRAGFTSSAAMAIVAALCFVGGCIAGIVSMATSL